ncbi:hypothetical protein COE51_10820 [Bacillus pseudomycoides]|nr:hypothetical protein COE51_10820 [Bacillus pseudomycoides]
MAVIQAGFKPMKQEIPKRKELKKIYMDRLKPIQGKKATEIIDRLASHVDRKENVHIEIDAKSKERRELKEQANILQNQYEESFDRETLRAKVELETEIKVVEGEGRALARKSTNIHSWIVELSDEEKESLIKAYEPIGIKERKLFKEVVKAQEQYVKAMESFKAEHDQNTEVHNNLIGLLLSSTGVSADLNRVSNHEIETIRRKVRNQ